MPPSAYPVNVAEAGHRGAMLTNNPVFRGKQKVKGAVKAVPTIGR